MKKRRAHRCGHALLRFKDPPYYILLLEDEGVQRVSAEQVLVGPVQGARGTDVALSSDRAALHVGIAVDGSHGRARGARSVGAAGPIGPDDIAVLHPARGGVGKVLVHVGAAADRAVEQRITSLGVVADDG